jgi:hypothetical protein
MAKSGFPLEDAVKQRAGLAARNAENVGGATLEQEFSEMVAGVHEESLFRVTGALSFKS